MDTGLYPMKTRLNKEDVLAWIRGFEAVREVEREAARREPRDPARSMAVGLGLIEFAKQCGGGSFPTDRIRDDEVESVRERWATLRRAVTS